MSKNLKDIIYREVKKSFRYDNLKKIIDIYFDTLLFPLNNPNLKLDGITQRVPNALQKIFEGNVKSDNIAYFIEFAKIEPYFRKILYLIDKNKFYELENKKAGLGAFINALDLNPNKINFNKPYTLTNISDCGEHLYKAYNLRNIESHQCEDWTNKELYENIESVLIVYLYATYRYVDKLEKVVSKYNLKAIDFSDYLKSVIKAFQKRIGKFIHIHSIENIHFTQGVVFENISEDDEKKERKGTVDELRKNLIPEKRMIIWGDAGTGKSTTLEYLAYIDAKEKLKNPINKLPVYIPLGLLTDKNLSLEQAIFNKIGVDENIGINMLKTGEINLFLDAVNEIPKDDNYQLKTLRLREIDNLVKNYKKTFIIISNRPEEQNVFKGLPVFFLQKMNREQVELFLEKNTDNKKISDLIIAEIKKDKRLEKIISTPLMLSRLIEIVKAKGAIPKSEGEIIDKFLFSLYEREREEKKDANFNIKIIHRLLRYLGYQSLETKDTNSGMTEDEVLNYFIECKNNFGFNIDTIYVLETVTQLGILEKRDEMYSFAHQAYQDYYHAQEEKAILGL